MNLTRTQLACLDWLAGPRTTPIGNWSIRTYGALEAAGAIEYATGQVRISYRVLDAGRIELARHTDPADPTAN